MRLSMELVELSPIIKYLPSGIIPSKGMNPILLIPISADIDTLEELMASRDDIFPKEPDFLER